MAGKSCVICGCYSSRSFCPSCKDTAYQYFDKICEYLKKTPLPTVMTTYAATNVPLRIIYGLKDAGLIDIIPSNGKVVVGQGQFLSKALS